MASGGDVLTMLVPSGGWVIYGNDFDSIIWNEDAVKITKEEFEEGFDKYDSWKTKQDSDKRAKRNALLEKLGISEEEAQILLS